MGDVIKGSFRSEAFLTGTRAACNSSLRFANCSILFSDFRGVIHGALAKEYFAAYASTSGCLGVLYAKK